MITAVRTTARPMSSTKPGPREGGRVFYVMHYEPRLKPIRYRPDTISVPRLFQSLAIDVATREDEYECDERPRADGGKLVRHDECRLR